MKETVKTNITQHIKESGMLNLRGLNSFSKKIKKQNPKGINRIMGPQPDTGTGISYVNGTTYK
jgi:hypothetical protein